MPQTPSTRWCPTPEQLMILEEMYRSGVRTPNASQIQQITAHLSYYGKIEGKNVFYWFQNHKARDRQKLRRRLGCYHQLLHNQPEKVSSLPPPLLHPNVPHFLHQGCFQDLTTQGMGLPGDVEASRTEEHEPAAGATENKQEWVATMDVGWTLSPRRRPVKTLDLFPTTSTGLKDECSSSKSSSCSTSTN